MLTYVIVDLSILGRVKLPPINLYTPTHASLQAFPLTSDEKESLKSMADSLFNVALSQARRKITSWPPPSYSQNGEQ